MRRWHAQIQALAQEIDRRILAREHSALTLGALAQTLGYSPCYASRIFHRVAGMSLRSYVKGRKLTFALVDLRDTRSSILAIASEYGFASSEAFTRAFAAQYGITPGAYRKAPTPLVLRTQVRPFDCYLLRNGGFGMRDTATDIRVYYIQMPAHKYLHIKNQTSGYWAFWEEQDKIPGQDCDTICGLLDSLVGKLDGDGRPGEYAGQLMADLYGKDGRVYNSYGSRLPMDYAGPLPGQMQVLYVPAGEYLVFEHGPFDYQTQSESAYTRLQQAISSHDPGVDGYETDRKSGRPEYGYHQPERFLKRVIPVKRKAV